MQHVKCGDLQKFDKALYDTLRAMPELLRQAHEEAGKEALSAVQRRIGGAGKVQSWQDAFVGSRGGYAAVRPKAKTYTEVNGAGKRYAVGYVTNAIEVGHRIRPPSGMSKRYTPRIKKGHVPGKAMYAQTRPEAEGILIAAGERTLDAVAAILEG